MFQTTNKSFPNNAECDFLILESLEINHETGRGWRSVYEKQGDFVQQPPRASGLVEDLKPGEVVAAGECKDSAGLYLSDGLTVAGGRHVRVTGLDVLSDTPEGTALLDGILDYLAGR